MKEHNSALIRKPYDNFKMYHPDGTLMCYCSEKKAKWYATRGLGVIKNNKIKLTFAPNGYGEPDIILEGRKNFCVISGNETNLTKHHIIPTQYRKHFATIYKDKNSMDLAVLCRDTHNMYEIFADEFKEQLYKDFIDKDLYERYKDLKHAKIKTSTLVQYIDKIPPAKYVFMELELMGLIDKWKFTKEEMKGSVESHYELINKTIVEQIGEINLIVLWKLHFLKFGKPKFMPDWWKPNLIKIIKKGINRDSKSDLCEIDLKEEKLYSLIKKYELDEVANLYI